MVDCNKCEKREAVTQLRYSKSDLCTQCFFNYFEDRVFKANREFELVQHGDKVAVGVSGGKDSAALLFSLTKVAKKVGAQLFPVLVDEGIAGYRDEAAKKAEALCEMLGFKLQVVRYEDLFSTTMDKANANRGKVKWRGACSYCGVFRKHALNAAALELKCNKLAVGHNADDVAQTILMNLTRNEPARFLRFGAVSGVVERTRFATRIKPLVYVTEKECALYCDLRGLPFHLAECPYSSDSYRGDVKDFLNKLELKHPGTKFNVVKSFLAMKQLAKLEENEQSINTCTQCGSPCGGNTCKACEFKKELQAQRI